MTNDSSIFASRLSVLQTALDIPRAELDDNTSKIMLREQDLPPPLLLTVLIALKLCLPPPGHPRRPPRSPLAHHRPPPRLQTLCSVVSYLTKFTTLAVAAPSLSLVC